MKKDTLSLLDKEESERVKHFITSSSGEVNLTDIFKYDIIKNSFKKDYLIIQGSFNNGYNIISSLPLYSNIFAEFCPSCMSKSDFLRVNSLLDTGCVFPILIDPYSSYKDAFIKEIIKYPHVSVFEFRSIRNLILMEKMEKPACIHCIIEKFSKYKIVGLNREEEDLIRDYINIIIHKLSPFSSLDDEILVQLEYSLKKRNYDNIKKLVDISYATDSIRTAEAFESPLLISDAMAIDCLNDKYTPARLNRLLQFPEDILIKGLDLEAPLDANIAKYIDIIMNNRKTIKKISKQIISKVSKGEDIHISDISSIMNEIANLNEKVRKLRKSTKYKLIKIGTDILSANKGLITTLICATILGFQGNILGCGASMSAGIMAKMLKGSEKAKEIIIKFQLEGPTKELKQLILNTMEPSLQRILSFLLWTDLKVIQTMRIRENIEQL